MAVALGALTRNTIGAIVAAMAWTLFVEQVILAAIVPGIEKWLPTGAAIGQPPMRTGARRWRQSR
jgi:ABC-2 type transport system permease protein